MKPGVPIGLGSGHVVSDRDPAPLPQRGTVPPICGPYLLRPNGCMDQDVTWYGARPDRHRRLATVLDGDPVLHPQKVGGAPKFSAHVYCGQTARWMKLLLGMVVGLSPGAFVLDGDPAPFPQKGAERPLPNFRPISIVAKRLDASRCHLVWM